MGRPPLKANVKTKVVLVRLPEDVLAKIDELAGENRRAQFIREAIERELKRRGKQVPPS